MKLQKDVLELKNINIFCIMQTSAGEAGEMEWKAFYLG